MLLRTNSGSLFHKPIVCVALVTILAVVLPKSIAISADDWSDDWQATIDAAATDDSQPVLVKYEASWCGPCRMLTEALAEADVVNVLRGMHLVKIDVDDPPEGAPIEGVAALPTMRLMTSSGEVFSEHVGFMEGDALIQWLRDGQEQFKAKRAAMLLVQRLGSGQLDEQQTMVLIQMLADRSPRQRAAAAGLLIAHPKQVATSVVDVFAKPKLRTRLSALDVLRRWTAPVEGLDPWLPETITKDRITQLRQWTESFEQQQELHAKLKEDAEEEAELELDRLVRRGDVREGVIESLGLVGSDLAPSVDKRLETETTDTARERLSAVYYRLVAAPTLAIRMPNVTDQLASMDADPRRRAAKTLSDRATKEDLPLLETLFGHSDPLVRELALRGLQNAGGSNTTRLTKLLEDPDKNVRAAVLKLWLDNPKSSLVGPVSEHALRETDAGLLVYYVRLLKELKSNSKASLGAMQKLASHEDWQVRAEVAEAISARVTAAAKSAPTVNGVKNVPLSSELRAAARELLGDSDSFVLSKIVPALLAADQKESFDRLLEVAWKHPEIRSEIIPKLTDSAGKIRSAEFLVARFDTGEPGDRAFALEAMSRFRTEKQETYIKRGVEDADPTVQLAAARSLIVWLDAYQIRVPAKPPTPPNSDPFEISGVSQWTELEAPGPFIVSPPVPAAPSNPIGGLLGAIGSIFGGNRGTHDIPAESLDIPAESLDELAEVTEVEFTEAEVAAYEAQMKAAISDDEPNTESSADDVADAEAELSEALDAVMEAEGKVVETAAMKKQIESAAKYDEWLEQWRASPESTLPWLAGLREKLEELAHHGGETETHAVMAVLRLGGTAEASEILDLALRTTRSSERLVKLYPWLPPTTRRELFKLAGESDDSADLLPDLLQESRRYDPEHSTEAFWESLRRVKTSALSSSWDLRRKLMLVTIGSEYISDAGDERFKPIASNLAHRMEKISEPAARLLGLSILAELAPERVAVLIGEDYNDRSVDEALRRDWARMAIATRVEEEAVALAFEMFDDAILLPVALAFITESYGGIASTETGSVEVPGMDANVYSSGKLTVPKISPLVHRETIRPLLEHEDSSVVARATYALAIMGEDIDIDPLVREAKVKGFSKYVRGMTGLLVLAIAFRNKDEEVGILEEVYNLMDTDSEYYIKDFYWRIRIMTGPKALSLRKRIRDDVGIDKLM